MLAHELNTMAQDGGFFGSIVDLNLIPYGASGGSGAGITCQHGEQECMLNKVTACTLQYLKDPALIVPYIMCVDQNNEAPSQTEIVSNCVPEYYQATTIQCLNSQIDMVMEKVAFQHHQLGGASYCPWVHINGEHLDYKYSVLLSVCATYQGSDKPAACNAVAGAHSLMRGAMNQTEHPHRGIHPEPKMPQEDTPVMSENGVVSEPLAAGDAADFESMLCYSEETTATHRVEGRVNRTVLRADS